MNEEEYKELKNNLIKADKKLCNEFKDILIGGIHPQTYVNVWECFVSLHLDIYSLFELIDKEIKKESNEFTQAQKTFLRNWK